MIFEQKKNMSILMKDYRQSFHIWLNLFQDYGKFMHLVKGTQELRLFFFIKYLRTMGFQVTNDVFAENAWYFRNALVRANYNDLSKGIRETTTFLELFLRNLLLGEQNELRNRHVHVRWEIIKLDIKIPKTVGKKTQKHIQDLFEAFGYDKFFGRTEVMQLLNLTASPASELIKKMVNHNLIYPIKGMGKGKYLFVKR